MNKKEPIALVLKKKNREKLENWYANYRADNLLDDFHDWAVTDIYLYGVEGAKDMTDEELLAEYVDYQKAIRVIK